MRIGTLALIAGAYPFFAVLASRSAPPPLLFVGAGMVQGLLVGTFAVLAADLFPVDVRFTGSGVAQTLANAVVAGFAPIVCTLLVAATHRPTAPAGYLIVTGLIGLLASFPMVPRLGWILRDNHAIRTER
jgi:MHS family proline/betaine transporter-like MFS transporter